MVWNHSFRKANISLAVAIVVMAIEVVIFGTHPSAAQHQAIFWVPFGVGMATLSWLHRREDRARERAERESPQVAR
jgi:hypothetical protein